MSLNKVFLHGRLTKDPDFRQTQSQIPVCRITVAVDRYSKDKEKQADFIEVVAWRQTAEFINRYFSKGTAIIIEGSLHNNNYTDKDGVKHYSYTVNAEQVYFAESKKSQQSDAPDLNPDDFEVIGDEETPF